MKKTILLFLICIGSFHLSGQIIYTDVIPDKNYSCSYVSSSSPWGSCSSFYNVDINHDGINDYRFNYSASSDQYSSYNSNSITSLNANMVADSSTSSFPYHLGDTINSDLFWASSGTFRYYSSWFSGPTTTSGIWPYNSGDYYLGLKLIIDSNIYYGWIRIAGGLLIKDYAYELTQNYIVAGELPFGVGIGDNPNPDLHYDIFPNPATSQITITNYNFSSSDKTTITIFNLTGEQMMFDTFHGKDHTEMDVSALSKGLYVVKIQNAEGMVCKKLVIE